MKTTFKSLLSLILAVLMVLSILPAAALAAQTDISAEKIIEFDFSKVTSGSNGTATVTGTAYGGKTVTATAQNVTFKNGVAVFTADSGAGITCTPGSSDPMKNLTAGSGATVCAWIKTTADSFAYDLVSYGALQSSKELGASMELLAVSNQNFDATAYYRNSSGQSQNQKIINPDKTLYKPGQWQLVTLVESPSGSNTALTLYVDGQLCGTRTQSNKTLLGFATDANADSYYIGYKPTAEAAQYFVGEMDSVTVYNKALSQSEINTLYENYFKAVTVLDSDWEVEKQNENLAVNADGSITITTEAGTIGDSNGMNNVLYRKIPNSTDYNFTVKVSGNFTKNFQGAYLMIASGKNLENAVGVVRRYHGYLGGNYGTSLLMGVMNDGVSPAEYYTGAADIGNEFYLRLQKNNDRITGYYASKYSENDADWIQIIDTTKNNVGYINKGNGLVAPDEIYVAVGAANGGGSTATQITFSDLRIDGIPYAFATTTGALKEVSLTAPGKIDVGASAALTLKGVDYNGEPITAFDSVRYSSSDEEVAVVSQEGVVQGKSGGYADIVVTASKGGITKSATTQVQIGDIVVEDSWTVTSPNGNTSLTVERITGGTLQYHAQQGGVTNIPTSPMGIVTSLGDYSRKLVVKSVSDITEIDESYEMISGKSDLYYNHCYEQTITFTRKDNPGVEFDVVIRAYDDGTAFRYGIRGKDGQALRISDETTGLQLPAQATVYWMNYANAKWNYESNYAVTTTEGLQVGATPSMPMLYSKSGVWTLYTEANLSGSYCGSMTRVAENGMLDVEFAPLQSGDVVTTVPFESPWRVAITGDAEAIVENNLVENLNEPADYDTYKFDEWVDPGLSSWSWVTNWGSGVSDQTKGETHMKWIQLAADMGWEYYILDEGWNPGGRGNVSGFRDWWPEVRALADELGVKLIAWVHVSDIDTAEERAEHFKEWSENGIVGIKADFFDGESQEKLQIYDDLYADAAKYKLMVNCHGANKPTGEIRTWPNVFAREGIKGQEAGGITSEQYTIIPFIRGAVGPADVTEELRSKDYNKTTMGFQVALTVLFEDGIHSMGSSPEVYQSVPEALTYYVDYPDEWDETQLVSAEIAEYLNMARRAGEDWYLSGITVDAREQNVSLSFLDDGTIYTAQLFRENGRQDIDMDVIEGLTDDDTIHVSMLYGGGYAVRLIPIGVEEEPTTPTEPEETEPVETEPVETEPVETEPVETEPVETEPVETEPVETEPVETEPVETEPVETEPVETEPVETEPPATEPVQSVLIEAEKYNTMKGIQVEGCSEGGSNVGYIEAGDWMSYHDVNIPVTGTYVVQFRVSSPNSNGVLRLEKNAGATNLGEISIPNTGGWQNWQTITMAVELPAGKQQIGIAVPVGGWNINWFRFTPVTDASVMIEAEKYNNMKGIQVEGCGEGGSNVGYIEAGDWMSYNDVNIPESGTYVVEFRVSSPNSNGVLRLEKNAGATNLGEISIPNTGGWQNWKTITMTVELTAGKQQIGIAVPVGGWNINWFRLTKI